MATDGPNLCANCPLVVTGQGVYTRDYFIPARCRRQPIMRRLRLWLADLATAVGIVALTVAALAGAWVLGKALIAILTGGGQ